MLQAGQPTNHVLTSCKKQEIFLFSKVSTPAMRPTPLHIQWVPGVVFSRIWQLGCEADHSPPSNAKVKNGWSYTTTPQYAFMAFFFFFFNFDIFVLKNVIFLFWPQPFLAPFPPAPHPIIFHTFTHVFLSFPSMPIS